MKKKIGYGQILPVFGDFEQNLLKVKAMAARAGGADLLVFPELGLTGYEFKDAEELRSFAEPFATGPTSEEMARLATTLNVTLVIGYPELADGKVYNACVLAAPGGDLHNYRKLHLFSRETFLFSPGDEAAPVVETPAGRVGMMICFDWIFPETARSLALQGAQIIAHPSNLVLQYCQRAMYARSVENRVFTITANRIGTEERAGSSLTFTGASQVLNPRGDTLVSAPNDEEHLGVAEADLAQADDKHITEYNHLMAQRRPDMYQGLL